VGQGGVSWRIKGKDKGSMTGKERGKKGARMGEQGGTGNKIPDWLVSPSCSPKENFWRLQQLSS